MKKLVSLVLVIVLAFALVSVASAASMPSPTTDGTPAIVPVEVNGVQASAVMTKPDGSKVAVTEADITKVAASSNEASNELKAAYQQLQRTTNVATVAPALEEVAKAIDPSYNASVFVVSEVFSVDLTPELEALFATGAKVEIGFRMALDANEATPAVIHQVDNQWKVVAAEDVTYDAATQTLKVNFDSLCPVAILSIVPENLIASNDGEVPVLVYILLAVILVLVIVLIVLVVVVIKLLGKLKATVNDNGPKDDGPKDEEPVEEPKEEVVEKTPAEEPVEETPVEEAPVEEVKEEVVEEAPVVEEPVEAEEEEEEETPAEAAPVAAVEGDGVVLVRYRKSYEARLAQAPDQTKAYYAAIKEAFLGIKNAKARKAWSSETFSRGRIKLAKIVVKGKTLVISLAIDPKTLEGTKYHYQDKSEEKKYAEYPTVMKLSSARNAKHVLEIIDKMVEEKGLVKSGKPVEPVVVPYETQEELIARGAIKVMTTGAVAGDSAVYEKVNIKEFINGTQE